MDTERIREVILQELPGILKDDPEIWEFVLRLSREHFADKAETESRFDRILDKLRRNREEENQRWTENQEALRRIQDEENQRWAENQKRWDEQNLRDQIVNEQV